LYLYLPFSLTGVRDTSLNCGVSSLYEGFSGDMVRELCMTAAGKRRNKISGPLGKSGIFPCPCVMDGEQVTESRRYGEKEEQD